jgi:hypothetical protein
MGVAEEDAGDDIGEATFDDLIEAFGGLEVGLTAVPAC